MIDSPYLPIYIIRLLIAMANKTETESEKHKDLLDMNDEGKYTK